MSWINKKIQKLAYANGFVLQRQVHESGYSEVFDALKPVRTEHALVRFGGDSDGGYLVPDDLDGIVALFSPGVDQVATFERDAIARGIRSFQIDGSVAESPLNDALNEFESQFLGIFSDERQVTLDDWVAEKLPDTHGDLMLQMDIEGYEWAALAHVSESTLARFRIVVLELHGLELVFSSYVAALFLPVLRKLNRLFDVVHLHANNYAQTVGNKNRQVAPLLEVTLLRKDRSTVREPIAGLPHPLDCDNVPGNPSIAVPRSMYA